MCWSRKFCTVWFTLWLIGCAALVQAAQPTVATSSYLLADTSAEVIPVTLVAGQAVHVVYFKASTSNRTVTVTDNLGNTYASEITSGTCASARCIEHFVDYSVAGGSGNITVTQSSTFVTYHVIIYQLSCTACAQDTESNIVNGSGTSHPTSASAAVIDTATNATLIASCIGDSTFGTETPATGWEAVSEAAILVFSQFEDDIATSFTDERGTWTSGTAAVSACAIVSTKETGGGGPPLGSMLVLGVGR